MPSSDSGPTTHLLPDYFRCSFPIRPPFTNLQTHLPNQQFSSLSNASALPSLKPPKWVSPTVRTISSPSHSGLLDVFPSTPPSHALRRPKNARRRKKHKGIAQRVERSSGIASQGREYYADFLNPDKFPSSSAFEAIDSVLSGSDSERKDAIKQGNGVFAFTLKNKSGESESWHVDLKETGRVGKGVGKPTGEF